jgi:Tfp pilus assembly protein PilF
MPMKAPGNRATWFAGSPQSLVGDLIREGVTGVAGNVGEPYLQGVVRPNVLFPAYLAGFNLAEAFYLATPYLSWQTVIVGDPLCDPFMLKPLAKADLEPAVDPTTDLPSFFSERRIKQAVTVLKVDPKVAAMLIRADTRLERGDRPGARALIVQATTAAPTAVAPHLRLALFDESVGDHDQAIAGYRRVLELQSDNIVVLNNLAYALAVHHNSPADARPFALRAVNLSRRNATIVDTLAWIEHLLGNDMSARMLLIEALRGVPNNADVRLHAAIVFAATGDTAGAEAQLKEALRRNPALEKNADVIALRERLGRGTNQ